MAATRGQHDAPIRAIAAIQEAGCVVTGSWDKTVKYWDTRSPSPMATLQLSERVYAMDVKHPLLVVATADRQIHVVDVRKPSQIYKSIPSNLKFQTRTIACFPDASGFAIGSVEGRCAIQHVEDKDKRCAFQFRSGLVGGGRRLIRGVMEQERLCVQVPPRRRRHLPREQHRVPPVRNVRNHGRRRHILLLGQGCATEAQVVRQVVRAWLDIRCYCCLGID
jgi:WD40 repeat protein